MSRMKSLVVIALLTTAGTAQAGEPLERTFAHCAGRMSADMEHRWLMGEPAEEAEARRNAMVALLFSLDWSLPPERVLDMRIAAKFAHASLLQRAAFAPDPEEAARAARRAEVELAHCAGLVLM
ncbi:hypothetical protein [Jannaschia pohangensis]|uniref:HdeA/HdeB family protein n=1 Tax=Jannaschia pohangensis TaxID=390807 RepID=A0A1I3IQA5_9RHOB|nr:hypothetical protein [Jannaschia pohangensis]SFI50144.1 hypothetical protein SAMN04488095_1060 [Jannaschia pohangensis]